MPRNRSLAQASNKLLKGSRILESTLSELVRGRCPLHVLEIGFGEGRTLLELASRFRNHRITFSGINKKPDRSIQSRKDLMATARRYNLIPEAELANFTLPDVYFYDATTLHFDDESVDLVYSVITIRFIEEKAHFLEEVCRVLRPGGIALLDMSDSIWRYPYSLASHDQLLTPYLSRLVLKHQDELIPLETYLKLFSGDDFAFTFLPHHHCVVRVSKLRSSRLDLRLTFNEAFSAPMRALPYHELYGQDCGGGFRSVYDITPVVYGELFERHLVGEPLRVELQVETVREAIARRHGEAITH